jgi:ribonuclease D
LKSYLININNNMEDQTLKQKKIALAQSEHAGTIIELMKDCMGQPELVDKKSEWTTIVNTITMDAQSTMIRRMIDYLEEIRKGGLHDKK